MEQTLCEFYVAGVQFHQLKSIIKDINPDDALQLSSEPTNQYDPNAVRVELNGIMLGYVPMKRDLSAKVSAARQHKSIYCKVLEVKPEAKTWEQLKVVIYSMEGEDSKDE